MPAMRGTPINLSIFFVAMLSANVLADPASRPIAAVPIPAEVQALKGKVVRIYYDVNVLGQGKPTEAQSLYLAAILRESGATVEGIYSDKKADVVILGGIDPASAELKDPDSALEVARVDQAKRAIRAYAELQATLIKESKTAGTSVILSADVRKALGLRVTEDEMIAALDEQVATALRRKIPEFNGDAVAFANCIDLLRDVSSVPIYVNWRALEAAGIDRDAPIMLKVQAKSIEEILGLILSQAQRKQAKLAYRSHAGAVEVSTEEDLKAKKH